MGTGEAAAGGGAGSDVEENLLEMLEIHELRRGIVLPSPLIFSELPRESRPGRFEDCCFPVAAGEVGGAGSAVTESRVAAARDGGVTAPGKCDCLLAWLLLPLLDV